MKPTARFFRGFLQRFWTHHSHLGYTYEAAELSFGAPGGPSGGPVILMPQRIHIVGLVAENFESTTYLRSVEEIQDAGSTYKETIHSTISYGVCVQFKPLEQWLSEHVAREF
jgi:hypothetical protein